MEVSSTLELSANPYLFRAEIGDADLQAIRESSNKGWVLGNDRFREEIEKLSDRPTTPKPRGGRRRKRVKGFEPDPINHWRNGAFEQP